jgi:hypothetical protein
MIVTRTKALAIVAFCGMAGAFFNVMFQISKRDTNPELIAARNRLSAKEQMAPFWNFFQLSLSADHILWMAIGGLCSSLIGIIIRFIYDRYLRDWHIESASKHQLSQIRTMVQQGDRLRRELETSQTSRTEEEGRRHLQIMQEMNSMRGLMKKEQRRSAKFQNDLDSIKSLLKVRSGEHARCKNALDAASNAVRTETGRCNKLWNEINSMKTTLNTSPPTITIEEAPRPASRQSPTKTTAPTETQPRASTSAAKQMGSRRVSKQ